MTTNETQAKVNELRELRRMAEELDAEITALQDDLKAAMTAAGVDELIGSDYKVTWRTIQTKRFDKNAMIETFGKDCYDRFCKTTETKRFVVS